MQPFEEGRVALARPARFREQGTCAILVVLTDTLDVGADAFEPMFVWQS